MQTKFTRQDEKELLEVMKDPSFRGQVARMSTAALQKSVHKMRGTNVKELVDNLEALRAISEDTGSVEAMRRKVAALFDDDERAADKGIIPFMTVHKAKGLEFERVWMFESTFRLSSTEGENLYYVAATRAQRELYLVQIPRSDGKAPKSIAMEQLKAFGGGEE
jgi:ATP-dependent exoDNAse (exonuclease V) beta subunit